MTSERRTSDRRTYNGPGWISMYVHGIDALVPCVIADVSKTGAKLTFRSAHDVPEILDLRLSKTSPASRRCRVVWRQRDAVGVRFVA
jgi:hypothetical protein